MASVEKHRLRDEVELYREAQTMRRVAFFAVFVAATACMVGIVAVPMVYSYLQRVQSVLQVRGFGVYATSFSGKATSNLAFSEPDASLDNAASSQTNSLINDMF